MSTIERKTDRRVVKTKKALYEALISLMINKEFREITVTDLVEHADINRGTFYKHYQYKEDLLNEVINEVMSDLVKSYRKPYENVDTFVISELTPPAIKIFEHVARHSKFYSIVVNSNALPGFQNRIFNEIKSLARQDIQPCSPNSKINKELFDSYHAYAVLGMIVEWVQGGFKYSPTYMAEQLLEIMNENPMQAICKVKTTEKLY